ncbi:hypothetical protein DFJ73DRAFT_786970 [Zopfochytrium polystomum]|nr:hypothetical protein DFJ73DRAFT_786970 [Zopfochytrium polystomum]
MGWMDECCGLMDADDDRNFGAGCSFDPSTLANSDFWDLPILSPAEVGWQDNVDEMRLCPAAGTKSVLHDEDADFPILTSDEMGLLDATEDDFLGAAWGEMTDLEPWLERLPSGLYPLATKQPTFF